MAVLRFEDAEKARDSIMQSQKREIEKLYKDWAKEIGKRADYYKNKTTPSSVVSEMQMRELKKQLERSSEEVSKEIESSVKKNMYLAADSVVKSNVKWLTSLGFSEKRLNVAFSSVPDNAIRNIVNGKIYDTGWSLSKRIWSSNEETMATAYRIVAGGVAQNKSIYEISKDLQGYVDPRAQKIWNLRDKDGKMIYPRKIDYNAQRLARTLTQHSYQQGYIGSVKKNPFITATKWVANGSRVCPICIARSEEDQYGMGPGVFPKDEIPMDHPNGMCVMESIVVDDLTTQLVNWFNSEDGTFPEIDDFAKEFGYIPDNKTAVKITLDNNVYANSKKIIESESKINKLPQKSKEFVEKNNDKVQELKDIQSIISKSAKEANEIKKTFDNPVVKETKLQKMTRELEESRKKTQKLREEVEAMEKKRDETKRQLEELRKKIK